MTSKNKFKYLFILGVLNAVGFALADRYNQRIEERKRLMFSKLSGSVLEIGPGTGANLEFYPERVLLTGLERNPHMQRYLKEKASKLGRQIDVLTGTAEYIPLEDESIDGVVSMLVLCSVSNLQQTLQEIKRVLKPGGTFLFMEHVRPRNILFQALITSCWPAYYGKSHDKIKLITLRHYRRWNRST